MSKVERCRDRLHELSILLGNTEEREKGASIVYTQDLTEEQKEDTVIPAYSISTLLQELPNPIKRHFSLFLYKNKEVWMIGYYNEETTLVEFSSPCLLEAVNNLVEWVTEKKPQEEV